MKRSRWMALLSMLLVLCMVVQPVSAAGRKSNNGRGRKQSNSAEVRRENNKRASQKAITETETEDSTAENNDSSAAVMTLIEDETTVENGEMLRAATYSLMTADETDGDTEDAEGTEPTDASTVIKYFPVTLYDYDADIMNAATDKLDTDTTVREGIYFSDGSPEYTKTTNTDLSAFVAGNYYIQNIRASENGVGSWLYSVADDTSIRGTANKDDATVWTLVIEDDSYYLKSGDKYLVVGSDGNGNTDGLTETKTPITISAFSRNPSGVQLSQDGYYLCQWGGETSIYYGGYKSNNDAGNGMLFYPVDSDGKVSESPIVPVVETSISAGYEEWNRWDKATDVTSNGKKFYTGLVERSLDASKNIVFTKPEGGIFNSNTDVKSIYTNVEMPFVYDEKGFYTFDASANGVYFHEDETQGSAGTAASNTRLYFSEGVTQSNGGTYGDGSSTVWAPYNDSTSFSESGMNYHFGMQATIPFTMTPNGRINATDDESEAIQFSFSGDDDVWVFIDGQLVVDLGGIHNRLDVAINFAANTVTYSESNKVDTATGSYNDESFELEQSLFGGLISQDRTSFAASEKHELTIYYLERGKGSSNCKIVFNLPVNDSITVTKDATRSWSEPEKPGEEGVESSLTAEEQAIVDNIDFTFTLYQGIKNEDGEIEYSVIANTNYYLLNKNGQVISSPATDANGQFTLKNGQSAKFITTQIDAEESNGGIVYYVKEEPTKGFTQPDYNYSGEAANGFWYNTNAFTDDAGHSFEAIDQGYTRASDIPEYEVYDKSGESGKVTVFGSSESEDSLVFICSNYMDAELPNPSARPVDDKIVIDYGLPVEIDVLINDLYRGDSIELLRVTGEGLTVEEKGGTITAEGNAPIYGTAEIKNKKIVYTLNKQLTGVEVLSYLVKVTGSEINEKTGITTTASEYAVAKVYIIPATTMYYEENFTGLVTYTGSGWDSEYTKDSTYMNDFQEPGVVGTIGDSPYGSDVAYLNDSKDSNGTSRHASTENSAVRFSYEFTGTGTSFYVRTTNNTGYMLVNIKDADGITVQSLYRDTVYMTDDDNATLYNIPVFTSDEFHYGKYTVTVTIARKNDNVGYHSDFWLDGIRIVKPLEDIEDENNANYSNYVIATAAYAADSEQNMVNVTLRNKLIREADYDDEGNLIWADGGNFVLFTDTEGELKTVEEYESIGPKEEVYLNSGQKITFSLTNWNPNGSKVYLGMKAPFGSGTAKVNGAAISVNNAADCYYDISNNAVITTDEEGIKTATFTIEAVNSLISVTNIKVTGDSEFTIIENEDVDVDGSENEDIEIDGSEGEEPEEGSDEE